MLKLAGFIMTYNRPHLIGDYIRAVFDQTLPPQKIVIVDNNDNDETRDVIESLQDSRLEYIKVGYNAGPAGAARIGISKLKEDGYDWIVWCDDDDLPRFRDSFEQVLKMVVGIGNIGIAGAVGSRFNWSNGFLKRLEDEELQGLVHVDTVAGGMVMMINSQVIKMGILPDENLFFGFEELDFCLRVKQAGFNIVVNGDLSYRYRKATGRLNLKKGSSFEGWKYVKSKEVLWREYYSIRNFCYLMLYKYKRPKLVIILGVRVLYKMITGFKVYGLYGFMNCRILFMALKDAYLKRMGRNDEIHRLVKS